MVKRCTLKWNPKEFETNIQHDWEIQAFYENLPLFRDCEVTIEILPSSCQVNFLNGKMHLNSYLTNWKIFHDKEETVNIPLKVYQIEKQFSG